MSRENADEIKFELEKLGFVVEQQKIEDGSWKIEAYTKFSAVQLFEHSAAKGFLTGVNFTLQNLAKPQLF